MRSALPWLALAAAAAALLIGRGRDSSTPARGSTLHARVLRVVDGDTIQVRLDGGRVERVRYIGVDTPESVKPDTPVQCFAKKASHFNESLVDGRAVTLRLDAEQRPPPRLRVRRPDVRQPRAGHARLRADADDPAERRSRGRVREAGAACAEGRRGLMERLCVVRFAAHGHQDAPES
jgi:hypothetical protein